jgi:hypothetical protein
MTELAHPLLTDCLGILTPHITLARRDGRCPTYPACRHAAGYCRYPVAWGLDGTAEQIGRWQHRWATLEEARSALEAAGYAVSDEPINLAGCYDVIHLATAAEAHRRDNADAAKWADAEPCYVRYGDIPATGRSLNHADGTAEAGVSVFRGQRLPSGEARAIPATNQQMGSYLTLLGRPLYIVEGDLVGVGSDGEPLLTHCRSHRARLPER